MCPTEPFLYGWAGIRIRLSGVLSDSGVPLHD
jgi:hypothetical protein